MATQNPNKNNAEELKATASRLSTVPTETSEASAPAALLFDKSNYRLMLVGLGLVVLGFILMSGGKMPDANTWDESLIYSFVRITLAPIVILTGLGVEIYAIFARK